MTLFQCSIIVNPFIGLVKAAKENLTGTGDNDKLETALLWLFMGKVRRVKTRANVENCRVYKGFKEPSKGAQ